MAELKFYACKKCGLVVATVVEGSCTPQCCGEPMKLLKAGETDAATEKHVPVVTREGDVLTAKVGSVEHPMLDEHYIQWVAVATNDGADVQFHHFKPGEKPEAKFVVPAGTPAEVYEYCNLHGLWKAEA